MILLGGFGWLLKEPFCFLPEQTRCLLGAGVFGDGLGALTHGMLGQFTGQKQTNSSLDFSACDGGSFVVVSQTARLTSDSLKDIIHKAVHDAHCFAADASVWVHLLHDFVDIDGVALSSTFLQMFLAVPLVKRAAHPKTFEENLKTIFYYFFASLP